MQNGAMNPLAHMRKVITMEQALAGKPIAEPLTVYDCSLISDGAAAVLIVPLERAAEFTDKPVRVLGIAQTSDHVALDEKPDITTFRAVTDVGGEGLPDGRRAAGATSSSPKCTTASPSPKSSPSKIWASCQKGEGGPYSSGGRTRACTASGP